MNPTKPMPILQTPVKHSALRYFASCGLLLLPILVWDAAFTRFLPPALGSAEFWRGIPPVIVYGENALRLAVVVLPFLMPLDLSARDQRRGLWLFAVGAAVYFASWMPLMLSPDSTWSTSAIGFLAPAYTPLIWLAGIGLAGRRFFWKSRHSASAYIVLSCAFVALHVSHAALVYSRSPVDLSRTIGS